MGKARYNQLALNPKGMAATHILDNQEKASAAG